MNIFYELADVPIHSCLLLPSRQEALDFPRREIALGFCAACGFIQNTRFDAEVMRYAGGYEDQQSFSPRFNQFARELALRLIERHNLRGKRILEIGCGQGDFLALICHLGGNHGLGIDPNYFPGRLHGPGAERVEFLQEFYAEKHAPLIGDMVCCRHTLEHIDKTAEFLRTVRRSLHDYPGTLVFFEVPDTGRVLRELAFWDIYYEHCSYFTPGSLARLFRATGFDVMALDKGFDGQYLLLEARPGSGKGTPPLPAENDLQQTARDVAQFMKDHSRKLQQWRSHVDAIARSGQRAVIWGSSSKCVAFLATLGVRDEIACVVDINPNRHGKFLAGSGKQIVPPSYLQEYKPDAVIVMNPIYLEEISQDLQRMGVMPRLMAV